MTKNEEGIKPPVIDSNGAIVKISASVHRSRHPSMTSRRNFCQASAAALTGCAVLPGWLQATIMAQPQRILLKSAWQVVNIGDLAHTPGVLALLERYLPNTEVRLWAGNDFTLEAAAMNKKRFPSFQAVKGTIGTTGRANNPALQTALDWCDFFLHGSGPSLVAQKDLAAFANFYNKPYGVYGITYTGGNAQAAALMSQARFVYFRDSVSLAVARREQIACPVMQFAPDAAFGCDLRNDRVAKTWLVTKNLEARKFVCCVPRARYTPYWLLASRYPYDAVKDARNKEMFEHDHAPLRQAIELIVRQTPMKVLICPEDQTQMKIGREWIFDKLPADVRRRVVCRDTFWLPDEAISTFVLSAGLFGLEMHSPIMCVANGIPAIVGRFAEQSTKGFMWRDIGLSDWLFDFDQPGSIAQYPQAVLNMVTDSDTSKRRVAGAQGVVRDLQASSMATVSV